MDKIRIFQFPIANSNGGITHYAMNNWRYLDKNKFSCDFGTVSSQLDFEDEIIQLGAGIKYISCTAENNREKFIDEMTKILKGNYDVVHLHTSFWKSTLVEEIAKKCGIPQIIVHSHSTMIDMIDVDKRKEAEKQHNIIKASFSTSQATDFWACSKLAAGWLFGENIPQDRIKIMKNAINIDKFVFNEQIRKINRKELNLNNNFVICNVGRLSYSKNQEFLLYVFSKVVKEIKNAVLLLVGDGILRAKLKELSQDLKIDDKVVFLGNRDDTNCILQASDAFCLPSRFEGLPISAIEAQASGIKCLVSNSITDEVCITNNIERVDFDINAWVDRILEISKGYERRNMNDAITNMGYNIKYQIKEIEKIYSEVGYEA